MTVCRLCLSTTSDEYRELESVDEKYFEVVLPEIDVKMINSSVICVNCVELLRTSYLFKTNCLETEQLIKSYVERVGVDNINLMDVLKSNCDTKEDVKSVNIKLEGSNDSFLSDFYENNDNSSDERDEKRFVCTVCDIEFEDEGSLKTHNHIGTLRCGLCNTDFATPYNLRRHMLIHKKSNYDTKNIEEVNEETLTEMDEMIRKHDELYHDFNICDLICQLCRKCFATKQMLLEHVRCHYGVKCERCDKYFKDTSTLDGHLLLAHKVNVEKKPFACDICLRTYTLRKSLLAHIRTHFERPKCGVCAKAYYDVNCLKRHIINMHKHKLKDGDWDEFDVIDFEGDEVNMIESLIVHLERYKRDQPNEFTGIYQCEVCGKGCFGDKEDLNNHLRLHFSRPACKTCNKIFYNQNSLRRHSLKEHNIEVNDIKLECFNEQEKSCTNCKKTDCNCANDLQCPICGKVMGSKTSFVRHKLIHAKRKNFICDLCQKSFLTKLYLQRHINTTHLGIPRKRTSNNIFTCDTCGLTTNNKHTLIQHIRTHTGERPYKCDLCGKAFVQSSTLGTHKRTVHSTERLFTCEYCSKSFNTKGSLTKHILEVHMVDKIEKKFTCNFCGKKYRLQSQLTCHLKWHSSERQFSCDICGKPFVDRHSVKKHRVIHFSEKQHKCEICGKGFHQKYNIKIHMKVHSRVP